MHRPTPLLLTLAALALPSSAAAADFGAPQPLPDYGASSAVLSDTAAAADGSALIAGARSTSGRYQPVATFLPAGGGPAVTRNLGSPATLTTYPQVTTDDDGHAAVVYATDHTAYLSRCTDGVCGTPVAIGTSSLKPEPAVAIEPVTGRTTVFFRGRSSKGSRLQWRITTGGKLGKLHTLGEFGNDPQLGTDRTGKTVAIWSRYGSARGLRTAARRVGEFTSPSTLDSSPVTGQQIEVAPDGEVLAAWLSSPSLDVQTVAAQAKVSKRTADTSFGTPQLVGGADSATLDLARDPQGVAALALLRRVPNGGDVVAAAVRGPGGQFAAPVDVAAAQTQSEFPGPSAAVDADGRVTVAWAAQNPIAPVTQPGGIYAARSAAGGGSFPAAEQLASSTSGTFAFAVAGGARTRVAWAAPEAFVSAAQG